MSSRVPPNNMTVNLEDSDVHDDFVKIADAMEAIRRQDIADKGISGENKNEYLRLTHRLASTMEGIGDDDLAALINDTASAASESELVLNYDFSREEHFQKEHSEFSHKLDLVTIVCFGDDFRGFADKHHVFNAAKFAGSQSNDKEGKFAVFDSILPFNPHGGADFPDARSLQQVAGNSSIASGGLLRTFEDLTPEDFIYLTKSEVFVTKKPILKGLSWNDAHLRLDSLGLHMANLEVFLDFYRISRGGGTLKDGHGNPIKDKQDLWGALTGDSNNFNVWLDASFEKNDGTFLISTDHVIQGGNIVATRKYDSVGFQTWFWDATLKIDGQKIKMSEEPEFPRISNMFGCPKSGVFSYGPVSYPASKRLTLFAKPTSATKKRGVIAYVGKDDLEHVCNGEAPKRVAVGSLHNLHPTLEELGVLEVGEEAERNLIWSFGNHHTQGDCFYDALLKSSDGLPLPHKHLARGVNGFALYGEQEFGEYRKVFGLVSFPQATRYAVTYISKGENAVDIPTISLILSQDEKLEESVTNVARHAGAVYTHVSKLINGKKVGDLVVTNIGGER